MDKISKLQREIEDLKKQKEEAEKFIELAEEKTRENYAKIAEEYKNFYINNKIIIKNNIGYIFCLDTVADFIIENLKKVRHTSVKCEKVTEIPEEARPEPIEKFIIVASERLDVIIAEIYNLSRSESNNLFLAKKVFVNGRQCENQI